MDVDGVREKREPAKQEWGAADVAVLQQWGVSGKTYSGKGPEKGQGRRGDEWHWPAQEGAKGADKKAPRKGRWPGRSLCGGDHFARGYKAGGESVGSATGCFVCGGPHFARDCWSKGKGKGKKGVSEVEPST